MRFHSPYQLGATLYMPATRTDLADYILHGKLADLRSMVICLEDAIREEDVRVALENLRVLLQDIASHDRSEFPLVFVRPRNASMAMQLMHVAHINKIDGLVLPKFRLASLSAWEEVVRSAPPHFQFMPTLETGDVFDTYAMRELRHGLQETFADRVLVLRIGGNDLLSCLGLRRGTFGTIYDSPMGYVIPMLVSIFGPAGYFLTAPVCERFDDHELLIQELQRDLQHGLVGKTAIHPLQIPIIQHGFKVSPIDLEAATRILEADAPAVFQFDGAMCEPATHRAWAQRIITRAELFGCRQSHPDDCVAPLNAPFKIDVS